MSALPQRAATVNGDVISLQKSRRRLIESQFRPRGPWRIRAPYLNLAGIIFLASLAWKTSRILLQHNLPNADSCAAATHSTKPPYPLLCPDRPARSSSRHADEGVWRRGQY